MSDVDKAASLLLLEQAKIVTGPDPIFPIAWDRIDGAVTMRLVALQVVEQRRMNELLQTIVEYLDEERHQVGPRP